MNQQTIDSLIQEYNDFLTAFQKKAQAKLKEVFTQFWEENPGINVVTWTQYAPYFNDGEPCVFGINEVTFSNASEQEDIVHLNWGEYDGDTDGIWGVDSWGIEELSKTTSGVNYESVKMLCDFIYSTPMKDILENTFGSDNKIIATRSGFISEDYSGSHD